LNNFIATRRVSSKFRRLILDVLPSGTTARLKLARAYGWFLSGMTPHAKLNPGNKDTLSYEYMVMHMKAIEAFALHCDIVRLRLSSIRLHVCAVCNHHANE
jgi:hypothetical protein